MYDLETLKSYILEILPMVNDDKSSKAFLQWKLKDDLNRILAKERSGMYRPEKQTTTNQNVKLIKDLGNIEFNDGMD